MQNPRERNPAFKQPIEPLPRHLTALAAASQYHSPEPAHSMSKDTELTHVTRNGMVLEVALNNLLEPLTDLR